jgi:ABC-type oligopeptide transport system substrate-binding subunit
MRIIILAAVACFLGACSSDDTAQTPAMASTSTSSGSWYWPFGGSGDDAVASDTPQLGVNSYLWRATLDTLNFMPLSSADPVGGVVISDWYSAPDKPDEHLKVTVYILDKRLRADAVKVSVFRQVRNPNGWSDAAVNPDTGIKLENAILARARELRLATTPQ